MDIPSNKTLYSASLFVAEKLNFNDFLMLSFLGEIRTSHTPNPFGSLLHQRTPSSGTVLVGQLTQLIFHPYGVLNLTLV